MEGLLCCLQEKRYTRRCGLCSLEVPRRELYFNKVMDIGWVVPYILTLLQRFRFHIHVGQCVSRDVEIKYLLMCVYKG